MNEYPWFPSLHWHSGTSETEVLKEMKKAKKQRTSKEESFHDDRPRKASLKQRAMMKDPQPSQSNKEKEIDSASTSSKAASKKAKKLRKDKGELVTEMGMLKPDHNNHTLKADEEIVEAIDNNCDEVTTEGESADDSSSSVDAKQKINKAEENKDLLALKGLEGPDDTSDDDKDQKADDNKSEMESHTNHGVVNKGHVSETTPTLPILDIEKPSGNKDPESPKKLEGGKGSESPAEKDEVKGLELKSDKRRKRSPSSSSCSSRDSSSSSSTSSSSSSSSSSEADTKKRRKKRREHSKKSKRSKKSKKSKKHKKRARRVETSESSDDSTEPEEPEAKKFKGVKRNLQIFPGTMYLYTADSPDVVKVHPDQEVYISKKVLDDIVNESRSLPLLVRNLVRNVFTREALQGSTAQGYPNRVLGRKKLKQRDVLPRFDPKGRDAIISRAMEVQESKKSWRPRHGPNAVSQFFSQAVGKVDADDAQESSV